MVDWFSHQRVAVVPNCHTAQCISKVYTRYFYSQSISFFVIACQHAMHAERNIVLANLSVTLWYCI